MVSKITATINQVVENLFELKERYEAFEQQLQTAEQIISSLDQETRNGIVENLSQRFTNPEAEPNPKKRAAYGRILGLMDADWRKGVGLNEAGLPDMDWVEIPAGDFIYQADEQLSLPTFWISRYHITYKQFNAFLTADDGFADPRWWEGLADHADRHKIQAEKPRQVFRFWNHPFDGACWYDAIAFCRWWSYRLGGTYDIDRVHEWPVRLATEQEWEKAARGTDGRHYPWGDELKSGYANFDEVDRLNLQVELMNIHSGRIGEYYYGGPTAAGIFPQGASPYGVMDMIGTMWDLTLTEYRHGKNDDLRDYYPRVIRGGTWFVPETYCSLVKRTALYPNARTNGDPRKNDYSFRVATTIS